MTMYEGENDFPEESTSVNEVDYIYSCPQSAGNNRIVTTATAHKDRDRLDTTDLSRQPRDEVSRDVESTVDEICEQLDSVEMMDNGEKRPAAQRRTQSGATFTNGIHEVMPTYEEVYSQDRDGDTKLHMAIIYMKSALAIMFINMSPSYTWLNLRNHLYQTALHLAVITKQLPVVRRLLVGGADVEARDHGGNTALHIACRDGFIKAVQALLEPVRYIETKQNKYDIPYQRIPQHLEITNYEGLTALHLAATNGHLDIVKLLIAKRADVNSRDVKNGRSILHKACADGDLNLVRLLLKCQDCDINLRTYDDFTPFDLARARSYERITFELAVAGARYANEREEYD